MPRNSGASCGNRVFRNGRVPFVTGSISTMGRDSAGGSLSPAASRPVGMHPLPVPAPGRDVVDQPMRKEAGRVGIVHHNGRAHCAGGRRLPLQLRRKVGTVARVPARD